MKSSLGYLLIAIALGILFLNFSPLVKEEVSFRIRQSQNSSKEVAPIDTNFGLMIPKLGINSKVIKNVNPFDSKEYQQALTKGVAHAKSSSLPGDNGNVFIFSHSSQNFLEATRYNSIFYLLPKLVKGDEIILYYENNQYKYHVIEAKIVDSKEVTYLNSDSKEITLTLMTCYPPGTDFKRFIIVAQ